MTQTIYTPPILDCWCGAKALVLDEDFNMQYRVMCNNNHILTKQCNTVNRAVWRWNNKVSKL